MSLPEPNEGDVLTVEQFRALKAAWNRLNSFPQVPTVPPDREHTIVYEVIEAWGRNNPSVDLRLKWAEWVSDEILEGNGDAFKRMAKYVTALREKGPDGEAAVRLPSRVSLPRNLRPKGRRGAPGAMERHHSNLRLFAKAASQSIALALLPFNEEGLPSALEIKANFNQLRRDAHPGSPDVSTSEMSRCVEAFGLKGLLRYDRKKTGPKKGTRQTVRNK